jgi:hypothetical protein
MSEGRMYTEYKCSKGHRWQKYWRKTPWFGDYATHCPKCGERRWYCYSFDERLYEK